ncbi:LPXTG cell wall anchor domain-containing protein [Lacticaseibacillus nasuensis]|uniref:LPXTG cell wall anchor domain-containing protein n=1 Tax=Lacticaseibacillus nasuensis TaxID=944671 RepID=UPI0006D0CD5E|nr:LPXTG cell wall anchor domain-containing protein [Lacticaseibacillus nasuensis]
MSTISAATGDQTAVAAANANAQQLPSTGDQDSTKLVMLGLGVTIMDAVLAYGMIRRKREHEDSRSLY